MSIIRISSRLLSLSTIGRVTFTAVKQHPHYYYYGKRISSIDANRLVLLSSTHIRSFHSSSIHFSDRSKVEKTVDLLKDKTVEEIAKTTSTSPTKATVLTSTPNASISATGTASNDQALVKQRKSLWQRIVHELKHYYNGFKLLFIETKIAFRLLRQVLNGHTLTRRERKQFTRTAADLFRLVPFSVFVIVPFMEFTLPVFLKLFPNMLPSTFKEADKEQEKLKKQLKAKLEVAKFLQDTLEDTALQSKKKRSDDTLTTQFAEFMQKIRSTGVQPSTEEIMKFSSLFENKLTLDNLDRPQLAGLCKLLGISTIGPDYYLRFTLHLKLRNLEADDKLIQDEGITSLDVDELQAACRDRGMRSLGLSAERLRSQLQQWLDLHLNKSIPSTILLLSRALYLPENVPQEDVLKAVIQSLPKAIDSVTAVKIAEVSGERVDNTQRIEVIKLEDEAIRKEKEEKAKDKKISEDEMKKKQLAEQVVAPTIPSDIPKAEILVDRAPIMGDVKKDDKKDDQHIDVGQVETALEQLVHQKSQQVKATVEEIKELKDDVKEYKEDVKAFETLAATKQLNHLSETRSAKALSKRIDKLVGDLDQIVTTLDKKQDSLQKAIKSEEDLLKDAELKTDQIQQRTSFITEKKEILVSTQELVNTIRELQKVSNKSTDIQVWDLINQFDHNKDGFIEVDEILKALEIIGNEKVKISKKHLKEIIDVMSFNEIIQELSKNIQLNVFYEHFTKDEDQIDSYLINYLEAARNFLINDKQFERTRPYLKILLEYSWEKLNTGIWQNVKDAYRYVYAYACYIDVLVDCRILISNDDNSNYQDIIKKCDLGILLGGPILEKQFNELISIINQNFKNTHDEAPNDDFHSPKRIRLDDNSQEEDFNWMPRPIIDSTKSIARIHCPSMEQFLTCYMQTKQPVVLTGCIDHWPALSKWSFDYLIKLAGDRTVPVELGSRYSDDDWTQKLMTIADFIKKYCKQRSPKCGYLAQHPLLDQIPDLKKDICIPDYCYMSSDENEDEEVDLNAWIGPKQTISPLHNDPKQNLLAQVVGEKYIRLYDPIYSPRLYTLGSTMLNNTSSIDVENPDYDRFPLFKDVPYLETILEPGDMLYMPSRHWHYVRSLSPSFSVNFWWT
ncbi:unnamed protein product [Rotaria magnacalcarata]|uniref:Mitochondrial proton/calcium exchanger protein n=3 Tax=Rotaria magnacalcarata TaxID=392030 RepID=A0A816ZWL5_9BILA|nr:unnamed protein product [Rotaria magnacalcarata]